MLLGILAVFATVGFSGARSIQADCNLQDLRPATIGSNSFIYASDDTLLGSIPAEKNRQPVSLSEMSPWMGKATVAIEDRRFYEHGGIDFQGIARAAYNDVRAGRTVEGGSTITQQLVRNLYIRHQERTLHRKLVEACLAIKLSDKHGKNWILANYMNTVYYGNHAYGVEAAAQTYFSRRASKLSLLQSALLAGLPQAPSNYDPFKDPERAIRRRNDVLKALYDNGKISYGNYQDGIKITDLHLRPGRIYSRIREPYFFSYVRDELIKKYGAATVRSGGLKVYTTIDPRMQRAATEAIKDTLYYDTDPASALVAIDPRTGAIKTMTAVTPGRAGNQFNLAAQARRQAGSTFKTFVLTQAVSQGIDPDTTTYVSAPLHYQPDPNQDALGRLHLLALVRRLDVDHARDAALGQHRLRAPDARSRCGEGGGDGEPARRALVAEDEGRGVRAVARSRLDRRLAARHGLGVRHARRWGHLLRADGDHQGRLRGWGRGQELGQAEATPRDRGLGRRQGDGDPRGEHPVGDRGRREHRPARRREDGNDRESRGRLVRRDHAER